MFSVNDVKQAVQENQNQIWAGVFLGGVVTGHIAFWLMVFVTYYAYRDSKNVAFDSPKLDDSHNLIKITPLERGY